MRNVTVRQLAETDIGFAHEMTFVKQWNDRLEDIKRMFDFEPAGCFIAEVDKKSVGHAFAIRYGKLGWIGLLIVKTEYRRMGIGRLLMEKARGCLLECGAETVKLEAVPEISGLYRGLGFEDEYDSLRFKGINENLPVQSNGLIELMTERDLEELAKFDAGFFGADRIRVLAQLFQEYPQFCFVARSCSRIAGYVMCRKALVGCKLGPWVCDPGKPNVAKQLLVHCLTELEPRSEVFVGVPSVNTSSIRILEQLGFAKYSYSVRMRYGEPLKNECVKGVFAIGGPMKG